MTDIYIKNPLIGYTGEKLNIIKINIENADGSTKSENQEGTEKPWTNLNGSSFDAIGGKSSQSTEKKKDVKIKEQKNLGKKSKRKKDKNTKSTLNINKIKQGKNKLLFKVFNEFKSSSPFFKEYPQFNFIEKNLKNNLYSSLNELVNEIRNTFSHIFFSCLDSEKYNKTFALCESFENIYKEYDNKIFLKESKNLHDIINKLKKELRQAEIIKNSSNLNLIANNNLYYNSDNTFKSRNKFKFQLNDSEGSEIASDMSAKKYKIAITNKINKLSNEQKRGIREIISENCLLEQNSGSNVMKVDVNKIPFKQLKQLENYINKCIKDNKNNNFNSNLSLINNGSCNSKLNLNKIGYSGLGLVEEEKEIDILKNDDLSSGLSDDEDEEDE
jgi:hypothetical protein